MSSVTYPEISIVSTEDIMESIDTEFEDDSEVEDQSPRISLSSTKRKSDTTNSSLHELHTTNSDSNGPCKSKFDITKPKPVEGPRGPHLFRSSVDSSSIATEPDAIENYYLNIISIAPTTIDYQNYHKPIKEAPNQSKMHQLCDLSMSPIDNMNPGDIFWWTPRQVARWMYHMGLDLLVAEKFEKNDISGAILLTLNFEDLIELDISSFGLRTKIWTELNHLRYSSSRAIENLDALNEVVESMDKQLLTLSGRMESHETKGSCRHSLVKTKRDINCSNTISPFSSRSNSDIESLIVEKNKNIGKDDNLNSKGQQILIDEQSFPQSLEVSFSAKKHAMKRYLAFPDDFEVLSSVNELSTIYDCEAQEVEPKKTSPQLEEANLRLINFRDAQENVKEFVDSQALSIHTDNRCPQETTKQEFKTLPSGLEGSNTCITKSQVLDNVCAPSITFSPHQMERVVAISPELQNFVQPPLASSLRTYSPKTDISLSIMHPELGAVGHKFCHSVLKNFIKLSPHISHARCSSPIKALPQISEEKVDGSENITTSHITHAGWMRKRKTKILNFDWHNYYFVLKGTQLAMHKHECLLDTIDYIDIDDYAIVCSSFATGSKLHAALKAMSLSRKKDKDSDVASFTFQLVPASVKKSSRRNKFRRIKAHHFAVHSQNERSDWMREMMLAKAMHKKSQGYKINVNGNVT
ncbi:putative ph domain-containing protein [Erysiphe neolycopersici]|uniref:Putative ph domain-containing protein n=1 Tax=Erysiphe neolycopersici TaxID=212602 RepID=A0A420HVM4_9PEZI|nr:putative ph domain-containing protein [Erysiphe neolycopersici]